MEADHPLRAEYQKTIPDKVNTLKEGLNALKRSYTLEHLQNFRKDVHKLAGSAGTYGYVTVSELCKELEYDLIAKIKNFNLSTPDQNWFSSLDGRLEQIEKQFTSSEKAVPAAEKVEKKRVVVVDDDDDILNLLSYEFQQLGFEVEKHKTGSSALAFLLKEENLKDVFLLILDRILPDMDGLDVLQKFSEKFPGRVPVLVISVLSSERDVIAGLEGGAIDYIPKPFSIFMLMQRALNLLKSQTK